MTIIYLITAIIGAGILTMLVFAPFEPIDAEIRDALNYDQSQEKMRKALGL